MIFSLFLKTSRNRVLLAIFFGVLEVTFRILFSVFLVSLLEVVAGLESSPTQEDITKAYLLSFFLGLMLLISVYGETITSL